VAYWLLPNVVDLAEILDGESGEEDLKLALDQLRDDQISQSLIIAKMCSLFSYQLLFCCLFL